MHGAARETASGPRRTAAARRATEADGGRSTEPAAPSHEVAATAPRSPRGRSLFRSAVPARQNGVSVRVKPVGRVSWM